MQIQPQDLSTHDMYKLMIGSIFPRPIAWVSSQNKEGILNLAPFSWFAAVSVDPPLLCFSLLLNSNSSEKDTLVNIKETKEFTINIVSYKNAGIMKKTSIEYPPEVSEFDVVGINVLPSTCVKPPRVAESLVNFECVLHDLISFGNKPDSGQLVLGKICMVHVAEEIYSKGRLDSKKLDLIGRMPGTGYATSRDRFEIEI